MHSHLHSFMKQGILGHVATTLGASSLDKSVVELSIFNTFRDLVDVDGSISHCLRMLIEGFRWFESTQ
jgi:hypothetical protein